MKYLVSFWFQVRTEMRLCFYEMRWNRIRMRSHFSEMKSVFHKMRWDKTEMKSHFHEMKSVFHEIRWDRTKMRVSSCEMRWKFFSWNEMKSNFCEMKAFDFILTLCQNQNETRFWWDESFHLNLTISLDTLQCRCEYYSQFHFKYNNIK